MSSSNVSLPPLFLCLRVHEFAAQALVRLRPALRTSAVAVLEGEAPLESICAVSSQALRLGVSHGMSRTVAESFPGLILLRRLSPEEESAAAALMEMASCFTPRAQELPRTSALTLALDMTGSEGVFGSPHAIGQKLLRAARELGFSARIAVSANLPTAACLVRAPGDMLTVVPQGQERLRLRDIPLAGLGLTEEIADTLNAWGLRTAGDLAALLTEDVVSRLGAEGHRLQRLARGEETHLFVPAELSPPLSEHLAFDFPLDSLDSLLFALGPMLDQLVLRARTRALLLASVTVRLHLERSADQTDRNLHHDELVVATGSGAEVKIPAGNDPIHERTLKPALPVDDRTLLLKLLHLDLQAHPAPAAILAITLIAEPGPRPGVQSGLFSPQLPEPMRLEVTLARITALVGEGRVGRAVLTDTHQPEAFQMHSFLLNDEALLRRTRQMRELNMVRTGIALRRIRPPRSIQVWKNNGQLSAFAYNEPHTGSSRYTVERALGPWRQSGHWWSGAAWSREEWDVEATAADGTRLLCVLTHDLLLGQWRMEAVYD